MTTSAVTIPLEYTAWTFTVDLAGMCTVSAFSSVWVVIVVESAPASKLAVTCVVPLAVATYGTLTENPTVDFTLVSA